MIFDKFFSSGSYDYILPEVIKNVQNPIDTNNTNDNTNDVGDVPSMEGIRIMNESTFSKLQSQFEVLKHINLNNLK